MSAWFGDRWRCKARPDRPWRGSSLVTAPLLLAPFSTLLPPDLERLRIGRPQLGLRQAGMAAAALDRFLTECGF